MLAHVATRCCPRHVVLAILMQEKNKNKNTRLEEDLAKNDTCVLGVRRGRKELQRTANWRHGPT